MANKTPASTRRSTPPHRSKTKTHASSENAFGSDMKFDGLLQGLRLFWEHDVERHHASYPARSANHARRLALLDQLLVLNRAFTVPAV